MNAGNVFVWILAVDQDFDDKGETLRRFQCSAIHGRVPSFAREMMLFLDTVSHKTHTEQQYPRDDKLPNSLSVHVPRFAGRVWVRFPKRKNTLTLVVLEDESYLERTNDIFRTRDPHESCNLRTLPTTNPSPYTAECILQ